VGCKSPYEGNHIWAAGNPALSVFSQALFNCGLEINFKRVKTTLINLYPVAVSEGEKNYQVTVKTAAP
jgi:hypothetical protein